MAQEVAGDAPSLVALDFRQSRDVVALQAAMQ
jgi:hypothetical protein